MKKIHLSLNIWSVVLLVTIAVVLTAGVVYTVMTPKAENNKVASCRQSGGVYKMWKCNCSGAEATLEEKTGLCITADGSPAGELGNQMRESLEAVMEANKTNSVKTNCEKSGGTYTNKKCDCTKVDPGYGSYDAKAGYCLTADGTPGGELLEQFIKNLEEKMR